MPSSQVSSWNRVLWLERKQQIMVRKEEYVVVLAFRWINSATEKILIKQWHLSLRKRKLNSFNSFLWVLLLLLFIWWWCLLCLFIIAGVPYSLATINFRFRGDAFLWSSIIQEMKMAQTFTCWKKPPPQTCQFFQAAHSIAKFCKSTRYMRDESNHA